MIYLYLFLVFLVSYLIGSFPTAYLITRKVSGQDIRNVGTGNVGAMNVSRATGKFYLFAIVFLMDALKGAIPVFIVMHLKWPKIILFHTPFSIWAVTACAFGVVLGHCFSIYFKIKDGKFSGGKAISSIIGILSVVNFYWLFLPWGAVCLIYIFATGYLFLGQFMGTVFLPIIGYLLTPEYLWLCILVAIPIFIKQWPRFIPMLKGEEPQWYWKMRKKL